MAGIQRDTSWMPINLETKWIRHRYCFMWTFTGLSGMEGTGRMWKKRIALFLILAGVFAISGCKENRHDDREDLLSEDAEENTDVEKGATAEEIIMEDKKDAGTDAKQEDGTAAGEEEEPDGSERKGVLIALDPGHQSWEVDMSAVEANAPGSDIMKTKATGGTSGQYSGIPEFQLNLDIACMVRDRLLEQGYDVIMTREDNETAISNAERAVLANDAKADISVRIHANGSEDPGTNGALILIGSAENPYVGSLYNSSFRLGESILNGYCSATGMQNLGIQTNDTMTGINWSQIPVVILEMGFMTNEQDDLNMADADYRIRMADGIVNGINAYYGY